MNWEAVHGLDGHFRAGHWMMDGILGPWLEKSGWDSYTQQLNGGPDRLDCP